MKTKSVFVFGVMFLLAIAFLKIANAETVSYQGILTDNSGAPVPDSAYSIQFGLWDDTTGGTMLWTEIQPSVQTTNGQFNVLLGSIDPIPPDAFETEVLALELSVGSDPPMSPRTVISSVPRTAVSRRLNGDYINTYPGKVEIYSPGSGQPPDPFYPGIMFNVDTLANILELHPPDPGSPPDPIHPALKLKVDTTTSLVMHAPGEFSLDSFFDVFVDLDQTELSLQTYPFAGSTGAHIALSTDTAAAVLTIEDLPAEGDSGSSINMMSNNGVAGISLESQPSPGQVGQSVGINTDLEEAGIIIINNRPDGSNSAMELATNTTGPSFAMTADQTVGITSRILNPTIELSVDSLNGNFNMFNPQLAAGVGPIMAINTSPSNGLSIRGFNPQPEPPANPALWFEMNTTPGGGPSWVMFNPQPEPPGSDPWLEMSTDINGPSFKMTAMQTVGGALQVTDPMVEINADSIGSEFVLQRKYILSFGGNDSTRISLSVDSTKAEMKLYGGGSTPSFEIHADSSEPKVLIGNPALSNILTVKRFSATDPIADAWTTYSSRRWKKDIKTLDNGLDKVMALRGVSYKWKANDQPDIGLIAEEVGEIVPEVVAYEENGIDAKSVDYARLVAILIEATKEQQAEINDLKEKITELQVQVQTARLKNKKENDDNKKYSMSSSK